MLKGNLLFTALYFVSCCSFQRKVHRNIMRVLKRLLQEKMATFSDVFGDFRTLRRSDAQMSGRSDARNPRLPDARTFGRLASSFSIFAFIAAGAPEPGRVVTSRVAPGPPPRRTQKLRKTNETRTKTTIFNSHFVQRPH